MTAERDTAAVELSAKLTRWSAQAIELIRAGNENNSSDMRNRMPELRRLLLTAVEAETDLDSWLLALRSRVPLRDVAQLELLLAHPGEAIVTSEGNAAEDIDKLSAQVARKGFAGLSPIQILLIVLVVLAFTGIPVAELKLPPEMQELTANEPGYIALAIVLTGVIVKNNRKKPPSG